MGRKKQQPGRIGDYWLSQQKGSPYWYRTWFDAGTRQTRRQSLGVEDFDRAHELLAQWVTFNVLMHRAEPQRVKLADVFTRYYQEHAVEKASAVSIRRHLFLALELVDGDPFVSDFGTLPQERLIAALRKRDYAPGAVKRIMTSVKAAVLWAWKREIITSHPPFVSVEDGEPRERVLSIAEMAALWDAAEQSHLQAFIMGLICTMARPSAVLDLTVFQCDLDRGIIDMNPPGKERTKKRRPVVPMASALRPWIQAADGHLVTYRGKSVEKLNAAWRTAREAAGLSDDVVPYSIRHTMATELRARGVPELEIAGILGHHMPNFRTTGRYAKYAPNYLGAARQAIDEIITEIGRAATRPTFPDIETVRGSCVLTNSNAGLQTLGRIGAGEGIRTLDPNLGKVVLYP